MTAEPRTTDVIVYGAKQLCATCLHLPSSEETASWLDAALARDYGAKVRVRYIDIDDVQKPTDDPYVNDLLENHYAYPLIVIEGDIVGEGDPRLRKIRRKLDGMGISRIEQA